MKAAEAINESTADVVCIQHEFGLYGLWRDESWEGDRWIEGNYEDHLTPFLEALRKPALVTLHTVLPQPTPAVRQAVRDIAEASDGLVVMAETAVDILRDVYGITKTPTVIPHGMPHIEPRGRRKMKAKLGLEGRAIIATFGLVGQGKGLEYVIEAMPAVVAEHPEALYLIAGQTHPELLRQHGEEYRNKLIGIVEGLGMSDNVAFVNQYLKQKDIIELLLASDIYVTPYLDPNQITSGTLSYALGAGKAVVSTPYLHAKEALADERGILVDFRSSEQLSAAFNAILGDHELKQRLETNAYTYANEATWPKTGARMVEALSELAARNPVGHATRPGRGRRGRGAADRPTAPGESADHAGRRAPLAVRVRGDLDDQRRGDPRRRRDRAAAARDRTPGPGSGSRRGRADDRPHRPRTQARAAARRHEGRARDRHGVRRHGAAPREDGHRLRAARPPRARPLRSAHDPVPRARRVDSRRATRSSPTTSRTSRTCGWRAAPTGSSSRSTPTRRSCHRASSRSTGSRTLASR